ncbi:MAG: hypothetical protein V1744_02640 [Candidatus Altiarchaeota archaeon]
MADEPKRDLKREIELTEEEIRKISREREEKEGERLAGQEDEDVRTKSRMQERPLIEARPPQAGGLQGANYSTPSGAPRPWGMGDMGLRPARKTPELNSTSFFGVMAELVARNKEAQLREKLDKGTATKKDMFAHMHWARKVQKTDEERMLKDLKTLESRAQDRINRLNDLSILDGMGQLTGDQSKELSQLRVDEATRYALRQRFTKKLPLNYRAGMEWFNPMGDGAYGVMPYTYLTTWDLMPQKKRETAMWLYDNLALRWQAQLMGYWMPKSAQMTWFQEKAKKHIESLFDDVDEEIYSDKKFYESVAKGQARLEDMEEELRGYDRLTEEEEREVKRRFEEYMKRQIALSKEVQYYS